MKGVILCGGKGTRLLPATKLFNKHLIPILNNPMVLYPLETLKSLGIRDILIVSGGEHIGGFADFLGDGSEHGVNLTYRVQRDAGGIAQALGLARDFSQGEAVAVVLGDNIFGVDDLMMRIGKYNDGVVESPPEDKATLVVKNMHGASRFGVLTGSSFVKESPDHYKIIEKPKNIEEGLVVTGLYVYPYEVFDVVHTLKPSTRGELEITDVNNFFVSNNMARICILQEQDFWSDAGTPESLAITTKWALENLTK